MSESANVPALSDQDRERLQALWQDAAAPVPAPPGQTTAQALALGLNFRVNLAKAFVAAWTTTVMVTKASATAAVPFNPYLWIEAGVEFVGAVSAIFASLVQRMRPINYVTCIVLAQYPNGLTAADLQKAVEDHLKDPNTVRFAPAFGMNPDFLRRASEVAATPGWINTTLTELRNDGFLAEDAQHRLTFQSVNFEIGWKRS